MRRGRWEEEEEEVELNFFLHVCCWFDCLIKFERLYFFNEVERLKKNVHVVTVVDWMDGTAVERWTEGAAW